MPFANRTVAHNARIAGLDAPCLLVLSSEHWEIRVEPSLPMPLHWVRLYRMVPSGDCMQCGYRYAWRCEDRMAGLLLASLLQERLAGLATPEQQEVSLPRDLRRRGKEGGIVGETELARYRPEPSTG